MEREAFIFFDKGDFDLERTFGIIKPGGMEDSVRCCILEEIRNNRLQIVSQKEVLMEKERIVDLYKVRKPPMSSALPDKTCVSGETTARERGENVCKGAGRAGQGLR